MTRPALLFLVALAAPANALTQDLPRQVRAAASLPVPRLVPNGPAPSANASDLRPIEDAVLSTVGATLGGLAGFYGLGFAGLHLTGGNDVCGDDPCGFTGAILGAILGEAIGIGLGAHLGGGAKGDPWAPIGASLGVLVAGGMASAAFDLGNYMIVLVPVAQVAAAVWMELRSAGRKRAG